MSAPAALALLAFAIALALLLRAMFRPRQLAPAQTLPADWPARLAQLVPQAGCVPPSLRPRYEQRVGAFLGSKRFVACAGLALTDDMRIAIAGLACLLVLRERTPLFPQVHAILIYPGAFLVRHDEPDEHGLVADEPVEQIGESWEGDRVVLSWDDVAAALAGDEVNVVAHEFAHQLDDESPAAEGAPLLADYSRWAAVMQREFRRLRRHRRPPVLDPYGAESPAEFFGVVSEAYFQRGAALRQHHAELYVLLEGYYGLDTTAIAFPERAA